MSDKLKDIIRIKEKDTNCFLNTLNSGIAYGHNALLNREVDVDVEEINKAIAHLSDEHILNNYPKQFAFCNRKDLANTIKTALLSGKIVKEKRK